MAERNQVGMNLVDGAIGGHATALPVAPLFLCDAEGDWIELESLVATERTLLRNDPRKKYEFIAYAAEETKWVMRYESPGFSVWTRLLAVVRTPKIVVPVLWDRRGKYQVSELRAAFLKAVEQDDDVLTQFVQRDDLVSRLSAAANFKEFMQVWEWLGMDR